MLTDSLSAACQLTESFINQKPRVNSDPITATIILDSSAIGRRVELYSDNIDLRLLLSDNTPRPLNVREVDADNIYFKSTTPVIKFKDL